MCMTIKVCSSFVSDNSLLVKSLGCIRGNDVRETISQKRVNFSLPHGRK